MFYRKLTITLTLLIVCCFSISATSEQVTIAVAANFSATMKEIVADFEKSSPHQVRLVVGSSGKLYAQIKQGAPFDIFFSADQEKPLALEKKGLTIPNSRFTYALGSLVLWSRTPDLFDENPDFLKKGAFSTLAIANPKLAPFGAAAVEVLESLSLKKSTEKKWVQGESINQAYQFIASGNADLGFIGLSQFIGHQQENQQENQQEKTPGNLNGSSWMVPQHLYKPIRQDAVTLYNSKQNIAIQAFLRYFRSSKAQAMIHAYGYQTPSVSQ